MEEDRGRAVGKGAVALAAAWRGAEGACSSDGEVSFSPPTRPASSAIQAREEAIGTPQSEVSTPAANEAVGAVLQLFYLCNPGKDVTICRADLEAVLHEHLGRQEDVASVLRLLECGRSGPPPERFDFLSYWHGMECFFTEVGSWPQPGETDGAEDMLRGMQRFRDGILALSRQQEDSKQVILSEDILALLSDIQAGSQEPQYWEDVMQIVPREDGFGLTLNEVSESVCVWLRDFVWAEVEEREKDGCSSPAPVLQDRCRLLGALTPMLTPMVMPLTSPGKESLAPPSPCFPGLLETFKGRRKGGTSSSDSSGAAELHRAAELCEILSRSVDPKDAVARRALAQLAAVHDSLGRALQGQETELADLRRASHTQGEKWQQLEAEYARAHELLEEAREAAKRPEEQRRRCEALEREVQELKEQHALTSQELGKLRAKTEEAERELADAQRREGRWRDRCSQLEQAADTAEGQTRWMRSEVERQAKQLSTAQSQSSDLRQEVACWRWRGLAQAVCGSPSNLADLAVVAALSRKTKQASPVVETAEAAVATSPLPATPAPRSTVVDVGRPKTVEDLQSQVRRLQAELQRLRSARDALAEAGLETPAKETPAKEGSDEERSPRQVQMEQRCSFLSAQLQALLKHTHEVEQLLDNMHGAFLGGPAPDLKRRLSIQKVQAEDEAIFNELSQRLYTLEVQKADADLALRQMQTRSEEQDLQLRAGKQRRDLLLAELGEARQASGQATCRVAGKAHEAQANARSEFSAGTETPATSDARSLASVSQVAGQTGGGGIGVDGNSFLTPVQGVLRSSPKCGLKAATKKVVALKRFDFGKALASEASSRRGHH